MRSTIILMGGALLLASCGPKELELPAATVDRAATCGVVAAAEARAATPDIKQALPFTAQGHILHYALLAGAQGEEFSAETATAVNKRMSELQEEITEGKWQELAPVCHQAFPETQIAEPELPESTLEAQLACDELGGFVSEALISQEAEYGNQLADYRDLARKLDQALAPGLRARAGTDLAAQQAERRRALARAAKLGPPMAVMRQCGERFA